MSNTNAVPNNNGIVRYGPVTVDLLSDTNVTIGTFQNDQLQVIPYDTVVFATNVQGTLSVAPAVILNNGTTGQNISASTTLTSAATNTFTKLATAVNAVVATGDSATTFLNLHVSTNGVGQATTNRARTDGTATVTTAATHGILAGAVIDVLDMTDATFNAKSVTVISVPTTTSFTYLNPGVDVGTTADTSGRIGAFTAEVFVLAQQLS